jgi:Autophagy receptor ATG43
MSHNPATEIASAIQSASIKRDPSPHHDINPSTAASKKVPGEIVSPDPSDISDDDSTVPSDIIHSRPRSKSFPPLPDFRFEQSYLASIKNAKTNTQVILITVRDQVILPLAQGVLWNMAMFGWRFWNRGSKFSGQTLGARVRKWWWGVNNWKLPEQATRGTGRAGFARGAEEVSVMS